MGDDRPDSSEAADSGPSDGGADSPADAEAMSKISVSRGMPDWLIANRTSFGFTSYQTGQLFLVGVMTNGSISFNQQNFQRAMGLAYDDGRLYLGGLHQLWRLENILQPGQAANEQFDMVLMPRSAQMIGDVDVHELGMDTAGDPLFVNTKYSCLAAPDPVHSFRPVWRPSFISKLAAEDRCHLNGMAMEHGRPRYVTAVSRSDSVNGWRERRTDGGVLIDVESGKIIADNLSMPHSPRIYGLHVYLLDSGRGQLISIDIETGARRDIAFCPGFLRGMAIINGHAIVTISKPREGSFAGLALDDALKERDGDPWCGVLVIKLDSGENVEWIRLEGHIIELFDVAALPRVRCPMAIGPTTIEARTMITFDASAGESG